MCRWIIAILAASFVSTSGVEAQYYNNQSQNSAQTQNYSNQSQNPQWIEDQWKWNGDGWNRVRGHYENPPKSNMVWQAGHYKPDGYKRHWVPGEWKVNKETQSVAEQNQQRNQDRAG